MSTAAVPSNVARLHAYVQLVAIQLKADGHDLTADLLIELLMRTGRVALADAPPGSIERLQVLVTEAVHAALHQRATSQHSNDVH